MKTLAHPVMFEYPNDLKTFLGYLVMNYHKRRISKEKKNSFGLLDFELNKIINFIIYQLILL